MIKAILFDKDGTLLKFSKIWVESIVEFLKVKNLSEDSKKKLLKKIGVKENKKVDENSILSSETVKDLAIIFSEFMEESIEEIYKEIDDFLLEFLKNNKDGIKETCDLKSLFADLKERGILIGLFTSDNYRQAKFSMEYLELDKFIDFYAAADLYEKKPSTESLEIFKDKYSLKDDEIIIVGDSKVDMIFGRDTLKLGVLCGTGSREMLEKYTENILEDPRGVLKFL
ncbi:HAD family hydrolase [Peptoniphilus porci]|uniref:Haloacid dehalogenase n=1 Tax=Peptoniphilus porci TaxID=2652280 RepID=A0A1U7LZF8_9FIRM|nr:HAD family hydrolase [Peptoniphilus porci]OLR64783.1 haloacid dehalogenase [Peptoniphilus porci]